MKKIYESGKGICPIPKKLLLVMKLTAFLFVVFTMQVTATVYSQNKKLSLNMQGNSIKEVLQQIEAQSEYRFIYENEKVNLDTKVSIRVTDEVVEKILKQLFEKDGISYSITDNNLILINPSDKQLKNLGKESLNGQQQKSVTGKVTDTTGAGLPGVSVVVKGTTTGIITDMDGKYTLAKVPENAILQFSFVGMKTQEFVVGVKTSINVILTDETIGLEEVVAVGYGNMKKSDLTGSVQRANIESFKEQPNSSIVSSLSGVIPGVNVGIQRKSGEEPSIGIRGTNSISGTTNPLIVLDGVIYRGSIIDINPNDVESIDILKDASSAAIYGSQAANGVMIISSKKSKTLSKPIFNYDASYTIQKPYNMLHTMNRQQFLEKAKDVYWQQSKLAPDYTQANPEFTLGAGNFIYDRTGLSDDTDSDWLSVATNSAGSIKKHDLSIMGRSEKTSYFISTGLFDQTGWVKNDDYNKITARINIENKINDYLNIGIQSFMANSDFSGVAADLSAAEMFSPLFKINNSDGSLTDPVGVIKHPLYNQDISDFDKRLNLSANVYATVKIPYLKGLEYKINYSNNFRHLRQYSYDPKGTNYAGDGYKNIIDQFDWTLDNIVTYKNTFAKIHSIDATFVYGTEERSEESTRASASVFPNNILIYNNLDAGQVDKQKAESGAWSEKSLYSMGRLYYNLKNKYMLTLTVRHDGFSGFGATKKFGTFPSVAGAWVLSEENFVKDHIGGVVNYLKLRTSYGKSGNRTVGRYSTLAKISAENAYIFGDSPTGVFGQYISSLANPDLGWETTEAINLGLDFAVLGSKIRGNFEYYNSNTFDLLYNVQIPQLTGFSSIATNIGKIHNHGYEFSITSTNIKNSYLNWETTFNFSLNRNRLVSVLGIDKDGNGIEDDLVASNLFMGKSLGTIYDYEVQGIYQIGEDIPTGYFPGNYKIKNQNPDVDQVITPAADRTFIGNTNPNYRFSIQNNLTYKNWSLMILLNSIQGGNNWYMGYNKPETAHWAWDGEVKQEATSLNMFVEHDYWTPSNPNATWRSIDRTQPGVDPAIYMDQSFIRLEDVSLSYQFKNKPFLQKAKIENLKIYLSGKNLYTWTKWKGIDPQSGIGLLPGYFPVLSNYTFGLNISF